MPVWDSSHPFSIPAYVYAWVAGCHGNRATDMPVRQKTTGSKQNAALWLETLPRVARC